MWDKESKDYVCNNDYNVAGYRLEYFEPIILQFNQMNTWNNFWIFTNKHTKWYKHNEEGLTLDANYSS